MDFRINKKSLLLLVLILMISLRLSEPVELGVKQLQKPLIQTFSARHSQKKIPPVEKKIVKSLRKPLYTFQVDDLKKFDSQAFLRSFKRQVNERLRICLRQSLTELNSEGDFIMSGLLTRDGFLKKPTFVSMKHKNEIDPCIESEFKKMSFNKLTEKFKSDFIEIQWKISL